MTARRVIPIRVVATGAAAIAEEAHVRLERAGFMRMTALGEPRLSEFVARYRALGYEVELLPYAEDGGTPPRDAGSAPMRDSATIYVRKRMQGGKLTAGPSSPSGSDRTRGPRRGPR